jgi:dihydrofolate reductase
MTEQEQKEAQAAWEQAARQQQHEHMQRQQQEFHRRQQEYMQQQQQLQRDLMQAQRIAVEHQNELNNLPRQQYAAIVAVDERGGFSKDGKIPWHYPEDFKWFQNTTRGHICVMGRTTYNDINERLGDKAAESVLPNRRCYVITSSPLPRNNATAVASIGEVDKYLTPDDVDAGRTVFFCGGERIYREGIAKCNTVYTTVVNKDVDADRFFPVNYVLKHFTQDKMYKVDAAPDLRFVVWKRNG